MRLEKQMSNGNWMNVSDRIEYFMALCDGRKQKNRAGEWVLMTRGEMAEKLSLGGQLNTGSDWYDNLRDGEVADRRSAERRAAQTAARDYPQGRKLDCGCVVYNKINVMSASMGSSCSNCYDRMS